VVLAFLAVPALAAAQGAPLTLAEALEMAGRRNPEALAARERATAQQRRAEAVARSVWPRLSFSTSGSRSDMPSTVFAQRLNSGDFTQDDFAIARLNAPGALSHLATVASLELSVDAFGKVRAQERGQSAGGLVADAQAREAVQEIRLRVVEAYRRAVLARRAYSVTEGALAGARAREADVDARVTEGAALVADLLRVRTRRRQREADLAEHRADVRVAGAVLARLIGADPGTVYEPTEDPVPPEPVDGDAAAWATSALEHRPILEMARQRLDAARWAERVERRSQLPDLALYGQLQDDRSAFSHGGRSATAGMTLRWNAFDPARGKRLAAASADLAAAEQDARAAEDQVRLEVETSWHRARAARERYLAAKGGAEDGREALRVVQERRRAGKATLTDELETEAAALAAELGEIQAVAEAVLADSALRRAAGEM
jgi:outer membrane protein TolC